MGTGLGSPTEWMDSESGFGFGKSNTTLVFGNIRPIEIRDEVMENESLMRGTTLSKALI